MTIIIIIIIIVIIIITIIMKIEIMDNITLIKFVFMSGCFASICVSNV